MTSYEFEKAAKNAVVLIMREKHHVDVAFENLQLVWFAHELGHKKCTLYAPELGNWYPEVTYNVNTNEFYVDVYLKQSNTRVTSELINAVAPV
ncbi:MAG: hypothetical protein IJ210_15220 [Clostridia bacterium]|nr:hypothetical protein [Clostridia bacterium]